jgi:DNA polymerase-1
MNKQLRKELLQKKDILVLDTETDSLDPYSCKLGVVSLAWVEKDELRSTYLRHPEDTEELQSYINKAVKVVFWNAKYDIPVLSRHGFTIENYEDALLLWRALKTDLPSYSLKRLSRDILYDTYQEEYDLKDWLRKAKSSNYLDAPEEILRPYAVKDAENTLQLYVLGLGYVEDLDYTITNTVILEHAVQKVVMNMEKLGVWIDLDRSLDLYKLSKDKAADALKVCKAIAGEEFKPLSPKQIREAIYIKPNRIPARLTPKGAYSTDIMAFKSYMDMYDGTPEASLCHHVLLYRSYNKAANTYFKNFLEMSDPWGVLRCSLNQAGTRTGRFSCSRPNLQNVPKPDEYGDEEKVLLMARESFIARPNYVFCFIDYDQVELRLGAHFANEEHMINDIHKGLDLHDETAKRVFHIQPDHPDWKLRRKQAKTLNFAVFYGIGPFKFAEQLLKMTGKAVSLIEAKQIIVKYKEIYPGIANLFHIVDAQVKSTGYVMNAYGRVMQVDKKQTYKGVNYQIQSSSADLMKLKMVECYKLLTGYKSRLLLTIHDELFFELHRDELFLGDKLRTMMEDLDTFAVPITCSLEYGLRWSEKAEIEPKELLRG